MVTERKPTKSKRKPPKPTVIVIQGHLGPDCLTQLIKARVNSGPKAAIEIHWIACDGGREDMMFGLAGAIQEHVRGGGKVTSKAYGSASSAAVLPYAVSSHRIAYPVTQFMCHLGTYTYTDRAREDMHHTLQKLWADLMAEFTGPSSKFWWEFIRDGRDRVLLGEEAADRGLVDELLLQEDQS